LGSLCGVRVPQGHFYRQRVSPIRFPLFSSGLLVCFGFTSSIYRALETAVSSSGRVIQPLSPYPVNGFLISPRESLFSGDLFESFHFPVYRFFFPPSHPSSSVLEFSTALFLESNVAPSLIFDPSWPGWHICPASMSRHVTRPLDFLPP